MRTFGRFLLGMLLGGIIGSVLALLFAPIAGSNMRVRIYDYCTNIRDEVKNAAASKTRQLKQELATLQKK